jgi:hypothetical protein
LFSLDKTNLNTVNVNVVGKRKGMMLWTRQYRKDMNRITHVIIFSSLTQVFNVFSCLLYPLICPPSGKYESSYLPDEQVGPPSPGKYLKSHICPPSSGKYVMSDQRSKPFAPRRRRRKFYHAAAAAAAPPKNACRLADAAAAADILFGAPPKCCCHVHFSISCVTSIVQ